MVLQQDPTAPVIAIDGGAGTGKGDIRNLVAKVLGFNSFDSGVLYRALAILAKDLGIEWTDEPALARLVGSLEVSMTVEGFVLLNGHDRSTEIRSSEGDKGASSVAKFHMVRTALLPLQLAQRQLPGLAIDGRDMGEIFETPFRFFITVTPEERARRRCLQRFGMFMENMYLSIFADIVERDLVDTNRSLRPLKPHPQAIILDNSAPGQQVAVAQKIVDYYRNYSSAGA